VADDGKSIEEALTNVKDAIQEYVDSLIEDKKEVPLDEPERDFVTTTQVSPSRPFQFA